MSKDKDKHTFWIDKSPEADTKIQFLELHIGDSPFYATRLDYVTKEAMKIGRAVSRFQRRIGVMQDLGDVATPEQCRYINQCADALLLETGFAGYKKKATALQLENGRLKAQVEKLVNYQEINPNEDSDKE